MSLDDSLLAMYDLKQITHFMENKRYCKVQMRMTIFEIFIWGGILSDGRKSCYTGLLGRIFGASKMHLSPPVA